MPGRMFALVLFLGAAACSDASEYESKVLRSSGDDAQGEGTASATASASASSTQGGARSVAVSSDLLEFSYAYPAVAGNEPELQELLDERLEAARAEITAQATEAQQDAQTHDYPYRQHSLTVDWKVVADLPGWLSLSEHIATYGGGAHGNYGTSGMVWDRSAKTARMARDLFTSAGALEGAIKGPYCKALDAMRLERRGEMPDGEGIFGNCPALEELTVLLGSSNGATFDRIGLIANPYVAGPYAEGVYEVTLPVTGVVLDVVKPEYRDAFSTGR